MGKTRHYAGIGSRQTPQEVCNIITKIAKLLEEKNYVVRSGGAEGADHAFTLGVTAQVFKAADCRVWALEEVKKHFPIDRRVKQFDSWKPYVKSLLGRDMMQILGEDGKDQVDFVLCWAPSLNYKDSSAGGTGWAIRCALNYNIPVFNLFDRAIPSSTPQGLLEYILGGMPPLTPK